MKTIVLLPSLVMLIGISCFAGENETAYPGKSADTVNTISGYVLYEATGEALAGVEVHVEGTTMKTYTDFDGKIIFTNVKPGNYQISASFISYKASKTPELSVKRNELHALNIEMTPVAR